MRGRPASLLLGLAAVLALLVPAAAAEPPPLEHDPAAVRELADEILAREEFQPPDRSILQRIGDRLGDLLDGSSGGDGGSGSGSDAPAPGGGGSSPFSAILLVLAAVGVGYVAYLLLRRPRRRRPRDDEDPLDEVEPHRSAAEWRSDAERCEAEGRWKDGLRCRFRSLVEDLVDAGVVAELAGRTTGELRADLRATVPDAAGPFDVAATLFDRAWYGDLPTGADEAGRFAAAAAEALDAVARRPAAGPAPVEVEA